MWGRGGTFDEVRRLSLSDGVGADPLCGESSKIADERQEGKIGGVVEHGMSRNGESVCPSYRSGRGLSRSNDN